MKLNKVHRYKYDCYIWCLVSNESSEPLNLQGLEKNACGSEIFGSDHQGADNNSLSSSSLLSSSSSLLLLLFLHSDEGHIS